MSACTFCRNSSAIMFCGRQAFNAFDHVFCELTVPFYLMRAIGTVEAFAKPQKTPFQPTWLHTANLKTTAAKLVAITTHNDMITTSVWTVELDMTMHGAATAKSFTTSSCARNGITSGYALKPWKSLSDRNTHPFS